MRMPDERDPRPEHRQSVELGDLLVQDAMWATPPADLLDSVLAAIDQRRHAHSDPGLQHQEPLEAGVSTPRTTPDG
jgi:hypothetical protein